MLRDLMKINITKHELHKIVVDRTPDERGTILALDAPIDIFTVEIVRGAVAGFAGGVWSETYTRHDLEVFLRGFQAGMAMAGEMTPLNYEIPR